MSRFFFWLLFVFVKKEFETKIKQTNFPYRSRYFATSQNIHFGRINVYYDRKKAKAFLQELDKIIGPYWNYPHQSINQIETYQTMRSDQLLLQILWQVKQQCYENRNQFKRLAKLMKKTRQQHQHQQQQLGDLKKNETTTTMMMKVQIKITNDNDDETNTKTNTSIISKSNVDE